MRNIIFRLLAGLLALLFAVVFIFADHSDLSWYRLIGCWVVTIGFAIYSLLGNAETAERFMSTCLGHGPDRPPRTESRQPRPPK